MPFDNTVVPLHGAPVELLFNFCFFVPQQPAAMFPTRLPSTPATRLRTRTVYDPWCASHSRPSVAAAAVVVLVVACRIARAPRQMAPRAPKQLFHRPPFRCREIRPSPLTLFYDRPTPRANVRSFIIQRDESSVLFCCTMLHLLHPR